MSGTLVCDSGTLAGSYNRAARYQPDALIAVHALQLPLGQTRSNLGPVRDLMAGCLHLVSLTIIVSTRSPKMLFPPIVFTHLTAFATNIPHESLRDILPRLPHLERLSLLANCTPSNDCPLHGIPLPFLREITCRWVPCIRAFTGSELVNTVVVPTPSDGATDYTLDSVLPMAWAVIRLQLPFTGTEVPRLLQRVMLAAPNVEDLRLDEYHGAHHLDSNPFAVHRHVFANDLRRLPRLRSLRLKLRRRISLPADNDDAVVQQWLDVCGVSNTLNIVMVWCDAVSGMPTVGRMRAWRRKGLGQWVKVIDRVGASNVKDWEQD